MTSDTQFYARLGRIIRERRTLMGMSQQALAACLGVTFQQVQKYEKGTHYTPLHALFEIEKACGSAYGSILAEMASGVEPVTKILSRRHLIAMQAFDKLTPDQQRIITVLMGELAGEGA